MTQLQGMEDLMYFALIMLKRISLEDPTDPPVTRPAAATAITLAHPESSSVSPAQQEPVVATDPPEAEPDPLVATETKKKKKKSFVFVLSFSICFCFCWIVSYFWFFCLFVV